MPRGIYPRKAKAEQTRARLKDERHTAAAARDPRRHDHTVKVAIGRDTLMARAAVTACLEHLDKLTEAERADVLRAVNSYYWRHSV